MAFDPMRAHVGALFTHDARGDIVRVNEANGAPAPRFFLGLAAGGPLVRFRADVAADLRRALRAAVDEDARRGRPLDAPIDAAPYERILARAAPVEHTEAGPAFVFPDALPGADGTVLVTHANAALLEPRLRPWLPDVGPCSPMFVRVVDGEGVAVCATVRRTAAACEAGVETAAPFRGRGHALAVVAAWARAIRAEGLTPLYSTAWHNAASRAVARKLGLVQFGSDVHVR